MGKCSVCGNKILYNAFKRVKGVIYCLKCVPKKEAVTIMFDEVIDTSKLDFTELQEAMKEAGTLIIGEEAKKPCKYCGAKNSSDWLVLSNGERVCKRPSCRRKLAEE